MKYDRIHEIEDYLQRVKSATNQELMTYFNISMQTLRRDIKELEERHVLHKVYGGVVYVVEDMSQNSILDVDLRKIINIEAKQAIGEIAAACVDENDIIFVDSGTTAFHMIPYLTKVKNVTVITHSLHVLLALNEMKHVTTICLGGVYHPKTWTFHSDLSAHTYNYNKAFISTVGISINKGLTNTDFQEGMMKKMIMRNANEVYILADASKFGNVAFQHFADIDEINTVITEECPDDKFMSFFKKLEIKVLYRDSKNP